MFGSVEKFHGTHCLSQKVHFQTFEHEGLHAPSAMLAPPRSSMLASCFVAPPHRSSLQYEQSKNVSSFYVYMRVLFPKKLQYVICNNSNSDEREYKFKKFKHKLPQQEKNHRSTNICIYSVLWMK